MKKLLILSGKGGTGKTTLASSFIELASLKAYADCDVDAPNLALLMGDGEEAKKKDYFAMDKAYIDQDKCLSCGLCAENCAFDAIRFDGDYSVDKYACEGCSLCERLCPASAISMVDNLAGQLELYDEGDRIFSTASLKIGEGNSGLLVTEVKEELYKEKDRFDLAIIDGSPGIGCPVIASINDVDMTLIVAEPSRSGLSDLKRIVKTARAFDTSLGICINKFNLNKDMTKEIEDYAEEENLDIIGKISYDKKIVDALNSGETAIRQDSKAAREIKEIFARTMDIIDKI